VLTIFGKVASALFLFLSTFDGGGMGRFSRLRKNKKYSYKPRYFDDKGEGMPFKIERKLDRYRTTVDQSGGIKTRFRRAMSDLKLEGDRYQGLRFLIILIILLLIVLYILDFDLSIFFPG
jgi:hypothetical protein